MDLYSVSEALSHIPGLGIVCRGFVQSFGVSPPQCITDACVVMSNTYLLIVATLVYYFGFLFNIVRFCLIFWVFV